jgi:hypothetical protein
VQTLIAAGRAEVILREIVQALGLDKGVAARRIAAAVHLGYLRNLEDRRGRPAQIVLGDATPEETPVLPEAEVLHCCSVAGGINTGPGLQRSRCAVRLPELPIPLE